MSTIRKMREEDAGAVRQVDVAAFQDWRERTKGDEAQLPRRTRTNVSACRKKDPQGCFVAEVDNHVGGFIFSRTWGSVGWFGPFAVLPEYQGRGIGKRLIAASLGYLRRYPNRVIGLETMPTSPYNLGLYLKSGFQAHLPTILMSKGLEASSGGEVHLPCWSKADAAAQKRWLADLREATERIHPGLDYSKEIVSAAQHGVGETLVLTERKKAIGVSVIELVSSREGRSTEQARAPILAIHPDYPDEPSFRAVLEATEALARTHDKDKVTLVANSSHTWALERLLRWGYQVERLSVHMVLKGTSSGPSTDSYVNLARWAA